MIKAAPSNRRICFPQPKSQAPSPGAVCHECYRICDRRDHGRARLDIPRRSTDGLSSMASARRPSATRYFSAIGGASAQTSNLSTSLTICGTSRIDFFGNVVDPIRRKPRNPYNVRLDKSRLDIVDDGAKPVLSRHRRCLHCRSDKKCRRRRPDVTDAVVQEIMRPVEVAAGDKDD